MATFKVTAKCVAKDGTNQSYEKTFTIESAEEILQRFGLTESQFVQEAADNLARRISNGVRQTLREKGADHNPADLDDYVNDWKPGRKSSASPLNAIKKMLKDADLSPESAEDVESLLAKVRAEIEARVAGGEAGEGE